MNLDRIRLWGGWLASAALFALAVAIVIAAGP